MIDGYKEQGIIKNIRVTDQWLINNEEQMKILLEYYINYPDKFIDDITPADQNFTLFLYQRIFLRACMRYRYHYCVAPRAFSKSFVSILAFIIRCIFLPKSKVFICAPGKGQGASIAKEKIDEILGLFPLLKGELSKYNSSKDYTTLIFKNGSVFDVVGALDSTRGGRRHAGIVDEVRDHDEVLLSEVVLPLMNVDRRTANGLIDPTEPSQAQIYISSAGNKGSFGYEKLIELFEQSITMPNSTFVWGTDYHVPVAHGLLNKRYIDELKMASTYKEDSFMREYLSIWTGGSSESWIDYDKLGSYRKIVNVEKRRKIEASTDAFYFISVDVARIGVNTSVQVWKVIPKETFFQKRLVFITTYNDMHFRDQAINIKKLYRQFQPKEILIDGTGLGVGLLDFMVLDQIQDGITYEKLASVNDEEYMKYGGERVIYVLKANGPVNSEAHNIAFTELANGHVRFLIRENEAKAKLLATKVGSKMNPRQRLEKLTPYYQTTKLFEEITNIKVKTTTQAGTTTTIEQINRRIPKDRFSALEYALWRLKQLEETYYKKRRYQQRDFSKFVFFTNKKKQGGLPR